MNPASVETLHAARTAVESAQFRLDYIRTLALKLLDCVPAEKAYLVGAVEALAMAGDDDCTSSLRKISEALGAQG